MYEILGVCGIVIISLGLLAFNAWLSKQSSDWLEPFSVLTAILILLAFVFIDDIVT